MQEYKLVIRGLTQTTVLNQDGSVALQNPGEFTDYLYDNYLSQGWEVQSVDSLRVIPADTNTGTPLIYEFAYHLVRQVKSAEVPAKSK